MASGCAKVGPDYTASSPTVPQAFSGASGAAQGSDVQETVLTPDPVRPEWWAAFNDPALDELVRRAVTENISIQAAATRLYAARAQLAVAVGNLYPQRQQATGSLTYQRVSANSPQGKAQDGLHLDSWNDQIGLTASWELDFWGRFRRGIESAQAALESGVAGYDDALVSITAETARSYVLLRTFEKRLALARNNLELQREALRIAEARVRYGATSERDMEQAKAQFLSTQAAIPNLETGLQQTRNAVASLLGLPPSGYAELEPILAKGRDIPAAPAKLAVGIPADMLRRRPDVRRAERAAAAQSALIGVAKADLYPAFSLVGSIGLASSTVGGAKLADIFNGDSLVATAGPGFTWNILNYGRITNAVRVQDARFQELLLGYRSAVIQAQREVEDFLLGYVQARQRRALLTQSADAAERSLKLATSQYSEGATDFTTVLTAQQALLSAQDSMATSQGEEAQNLIGLYRALGGGWEVRLGKQALPAPIKAEMRERTSWGSLLDEEPQDWNTEAASASQP